ncbi:MAG: hypothetical protein QQW96_11350 [Tychonema bourrellyi B0820]|uniref:hypothetical protein n=1 Tax=Tychonema bourrellyi TaxID=54313 RepID=UPI001FE872FF|nr:hypothetical protein [Tychonema bourrellyi]MDQ2098234.1 hypothetical protein [Tychonema bourrellyi B0820]
MTVDTLPLVTNLAQFDRSPTVRTAALHTLADCWRDRTDTFKKFYSANSSGAPVGISFAHSARRLFAAENLSP